MSKTYKRVLTIAGSDSGGGAGIQADIKAISACGCYAASAITAVTVQNTLGVEDIHPIPPHIIEAQIRCVLSDIGADAIKIGMLHSSEVIEHVVAALKDFDVKHTVLDPVMVSTSGYKLIEDSAIHTLRTQLLPLVSIITPNIPEAEILLGRPIKGQAGLADAARELSFDRTVSVFLKAGHLTEDNLVDIFYDAVQDEISELPSQRIYSKNTHGTGCTLSSALASMLAKGMTPTDAAFAAKEYIARAIVSGADYEIGKGHGPVNHFFGQE